MAENLRTKTSTSKTDLPTLKSESPKSKSHTSKPKKSTEKNKEKVQKDNAPKIKGDESEVVKPDLAKDSKTPTPTTEPDLPTLKSETATPKSQNIDEVQTAGVSEVNKTASKAVEIESIDLLNINMKGGGYIGEPQFHNILPKYLSELTLENGDPIPLKPEDFCLEILLDSSSELLNLGLDIQDRIFLPSTLFEGKNYGDSIQLKYKENLFNFEMRIERLPEILAFFKAMHRTAEKPLFCTDPYWYTKLPGTFYQLKPQESNKANILKYSLDKDTDLKPFANLEKPRMAPIDIIISKTNNKTVLILDTPGYKAEDFEIVLNKNFLIIYGLREPMKRHLSGDEFIRAIEWTNMESFKGLSYEEMQEKMAQAEIFIHHGQIDILI